IRLIDFLKESGVTAFYTSLVSDTGGAFAESQVGVSSLMDSWLLLSNLEANGERTRALQVIKSRGMPHSNLVREFVFSEHGIDLVDVFLDGGRALTGRMRDRARSAQPSAAGVAAAATGGKQ